MMNEFLPIRYPYQGQGCRDFSFAARPRTAIEPKLNSLSDWDTADRKKGVLTRILEYTFSFKAQKRAARRRVEKKAG